MKIKNSILCLLLFFTLLPVGIFGFFSIYEANRKIDTMATKNLEAVSSNQIMNIQKFCQDRKDEMEMIANYSLTQDAILYSLGRQEEQVDREYVDNLLREQRKFGAYVASISILDKNFHVVGSSEKYEISEISELKDTDERFHTGNFSIGDAYERETDDGTKKIVPAYIGVYSEDELIGYIAEELETDYFDELRLNMDCFAEGTFYLLDGNGTIITAGTTTQKESIKSFVTKDSSREDFQKAWDAIDHDANPSGEIRYRYGGMDYVTYYSNVENTDWGIRITENLSAQKQSGKAYTFLIVLALVFLLLGMFNVQHFITKKLLAPIENMLDLFAKIRDSKDYSIRVPVAKKDEMGKLAEGINELLAYVEKMDAQEKQKQQELKMLAECDPLTGVLNKKSITQKIGAMAQWAAENHEQISVGFLDIDDFRNYNTRYGHQMGDSVILFVAQILQDELKGYVGRNGGDEFVFCYAGELKRDEIVSTMDHVLKRLNTEYVNEPAKEQLAVPCSIGIVMTQDTKYDDILLLKRADEAMYEAKKAGKNTYFIIEI